jgi:DNA helicase II / ATP-dependent DNA helicase PcrA
MAPELRRFSMGSNGSGDVLDGTTMAVNTLDPLQRKAATGTGNIQLVLAGPGSGKTTTLASRFVNLVGQGIDRRRILALTFTKKAADEMRSRIATALDLPSAPDLSIATFHGFAFRHLRRNPQIAGLPDRFPLWDTAQQRHVFNSRRMWWNEDADILDIIAGAKERLLDVAGFAAEIDEDDEVLRRAVEFFRVYESSLRDAGAIDFADMVPLVVRTMDDNPSYAVAITGAYDHVLVDEYQDINPGQIKLVDRFVAAGVKLWAVGDDDQTLYAFRAADVRFILDFAHKYRDVQVHVIDRNYRSATQIVAAAGRLIGHNRTRYEKDCKPVTTDAGEMVIRGYRTAEIEARQVAKGVAHLLGRGYSPRQIAVLYRTGAVGLALQPALQGMQIPYEVHGAGDLWQGVAARLVVGALYYLRDGESVEAMSRMGSGRRAEIARNKLDQARGGDRDFPASCRLVRDIVATAVPARASDRERAEWIGVVEAVIALASWCRSLDELVAKIAEQSASLRQAPENAVVLSTIHSAKGLEWEAVFLVGMEQGVLPHVNNDDLEEERRVAYVGVTRAKRLISLTFANMRFGETSVPSQFLYELVGKERHRCVWTNPQADGADERLPLLSDRERQRLIGGPKQPVMVSDKGANKHSNRRSNSRRGAPADKQQAHMARNDADGAPLRHGLSWSAGEDERLRAAFQAGEAIAAIAATHERKIGAITARLVRLGLITEDGVVQPG